MIELLLKKFGRARQVGEEREQELNNNFKLKSWLFVFSLLVIYLS